METKADTHPRTEEIAMMEVLAICSNWIEGMPKTMDKLWGPVTVEWGVKNRVKVFINGGSYKVVFAGAYHYTVLENWMKKYMGDQVTMPDDLIECRVRFEPDEGIFYELKGRLARSEDHGERN